MNVPESRPPAAGLRTPGASSTDGLAPAHRLTLADRWVRAPLGILYLGFLAILAIPVMVWMTLLHGVVRLRERASTTARRAPRGGSAPFSPP